MFFSRTIVSTHEKHSLFEGHFYFIKIDKSELKALVEAHVSSPEEVASILVKSSSSGSSLLYIKIIIFSLVIVSFVISIVNLVHGVKKYIQEISVTKRAFFALNFNIILLGVFGTLHSVGIFYS